jgi:hypothetical protein
MDIVDPTPIIEERIEGEVGPLREQLNKTTDPKEREALERDIRRRERDIRRAILGSRAHW